MGNDASNHAESPRLGRYLVERLLGRGGMAEVYLGKVLGPAGFSKRVVIKRILPHLAEDESFVAMFLDEARLVASLEHPNIAQVFDFGEQSGTYFIAMEYVEGESLRAIIKYYKTQGEQVPVAPALAWMENVCEGLAYAHDLKDEQGNRQNIVHRDISPENILVSRSGIAKVVDFGIAKSAHNAQVTAAGKVRGKLSYVAPEQIAGATLDRRADIYSLGVTLYETLSGARAHQGANDLELMYRILHHEPTPLHELRTDIDPELSALVAKAMARDPRQRHQDMHELASELDDYRSTRGLRVKSAELADIVTKVEAWDPRLKGGTGTHDSVRSLASPPHLAVARHASSPPRPVTASAPRPQWTGPSPVSSAELPLVVAEPERNWGRVAAGVAAGLAVTVLGAAVLNGLGRGGGESSAPAAASSSAVAPASAPPAPAEEVPSSAAPPQAAALPAEPPAEGAIASSSRLPLPYPSPATVERTSPPPPATPAPSAPLQAQPSPSMLAPASRRLPAPKVASAASTKRTTPRPGAVRGPTPQQPSTPASAPRETAEPEAPAPPAASAAVEPAGGDGWLNVRTEPWCEVYYRGELVGTTPINRLVFPAGRHSLHLVNKTMGIERDVTVVVRSGEEATTRLNLTAE